MYLQKLVLYNYKNYVSKQLDFSKKIVAFCGKNGVGKTNLLDAIYFLSFTKSYFTADAKVISLGQAGMRINGQFMLQNEPKEATAIIRETGKKEFSFSGEQYSRYSKHIGKLPVVFIAPDDVLLINGSGEERRKLIDIILSQISETYLQHLMQYNKLLAQRNKMLKQFAEQQKTDDILLEVINEQLISHGNIIFEQRKQFLTSYLASVIEEYKKIAISNENIMLQYNSQLSQTNFAGLLAASRQKDLLLQRTTTGVHKDDIDISLENESFKSIASQGQRKSLLFALKLAEYAVLQLHKGFAPVLLLDDVFEKLDNSRMTNLLKQVCIENSGQVFLTDTHKERLENLLSNIGADYEIVEIE
jgi:DNA replication and repair protein RecF